MQSSATERRLSEPYVLLTRNQNTFSNERTSKAEGLLPDLRSVTNKVSFKLDRVTQSWNPSAQEA